MSLLSRFKDLVRANLNDLISKAEDPEKGLNLFIEDAAEHLREFTMEVNRYEAERIRTEKQIARCETSTREWHEKAALALSQSREDLARKALEQEQQEDHRLQELKTELASMEQTSKELKEQHRLLEEKLEEAKVKRNDLIRRSRLAKARMDAANALGNTSSNNPFAKIDRMEDIVERREAQAEASYSSMTDNLAYEMDQLKRQQSDSEVDDALAKLRDEVKTKSVNS